MHRFAIAIFLTVLTTLPAHAIEPLEVRQYVATRKSTATKVSLSTLQADPASYIGKVFEIRGRVTGLFKTESGSTLVLCPASGGSHLVNVDASPVEGPGAELACLVKIGEGSKQSLSDLRLAACTYEIDLKRLEEAWQASAEAKAAAVKAAPVSKPEKTATAAASGGKKVNAEQMCAVYKNAVKGFNPKLSDSQADTIARSVLGFSYRYKVDPRLVCAVILAESHFRIGATSGSGAQGLGQLMPGTAAGLGVNNAYDPVENVYGSVRYIRSMLDRVSGGKHWNELDWNDLALALASYNAGPGAVKKHGGIPPYRETQNYVRKVTQIYKQLAGVK